MVRYADREQVVKSSQGVLSTVPQLQAEEKHLPTCPQLHRPIHHRSFNTFSKKKNIDMQINLLQFCFLSDFKTKGSVLTCCFTVHIGYSMASKTSSKRGFPDTSLAGDEDLVVDCVHSCMWRHHWRLQ